MKLKPENPNNIEIIDKIKVFSYEILFKSGEKMISIKKKIVKYIINIKRNN